MPSAVSSATVIEGFPDEYAHLRYVPPAPSSTTDPDAPEKRASWEAWALELARYRLKRKAFLTEHPEWVAAEKAKCRLSPAYFMATWGWIFEQRPERGGGDKPWLPYPVQIDLVQWFDARMDSLGSDRDGVVSKCRDMGASWTCCLWALHGWLFKYPWTVLFLSRKEDLVESKDSSSLFWKIEFLIRRLEWHAPWMLPAGFSLKNKVLNSDLRLINPETGAELLGESTNSNAGRGARATAVIIDEAAFVPDFMDVWGGLGASTNHRFAVSSESLQQGPDFYNLGMNNTSPYKPTLFEMNWWDNPEHDEIWLEAEKRRYEYRMADFYREIMRDARAGDETFVYPFAKSIVPSAEHEYREMGTLYATIDPGFQDETAIAWIQDQGGELVVLDAYQSRGKDAAFYGTIIMGDPSPEFQYTDEELRFMEWTKTLPQSYLKTGLHFFGDVSGHNVTGATYDSFYSVLEANHGIRINKDRMVDGSLIGYRKEARTHKGRREALREMLPSFRFTTTHGARFALKCLQDNRFPTESGKSMTEQKAAIHDGSSHMVTAFEYFAVHRKLSHGLIAFSKKRAERKQYQNSRDLSPKHGDQRIRRPVQFGAN
jgi:hypothetical protein